MLVEIGGVAPMLRWMRDTPDVEGLWQAWLHSAAVRDFERGRIDAQTFASHLIDRIKTDHDAFEHVADAIGIAPHEILFVDDNRINVDAARAFGMQAERCVDTGELRTVLLDRGLLVSP